MLRVNSAERGESESILYFLIELEPLRATSLLRSRILRVNGDWTLQLELAIDDGWKRLLNPSIQGEIRLELKKRSDTDAIQVFRDNLQNLLLAACVDLNTSSWTLLRYVAGVTERVALNIVSYRDEHGRFRSRKHLGKAAS